MASCTSISLLPDVQKFNNGLVFRSSKDPLSPTKPMRKFTPRDVFQHNQCTQMNKWGIYEGRVYENEKLKEIFSHLIIVAKETRKDNSTEEVEAEEIQEYERSSSDYGESDHSYSFVHDVDLDGVIVWENKRIQNIINKEMVQTAIRLHAAPHCVGKIAQTTDSEFWEDVQNDVQSILCDLFHKYCTDSLSTNLTDYMHLLQRWVKNHTYCSLEIARLPNGDPNQRCFPIPEDVAENPECLRPWLMSWKSFDCAVPQNGAWTVIDTKSSDLANSHDVFVLSLKSHVNLTPFDTTIDGDTAWKVIQENLFSEEVMTDQQKITECQRKNRNDLFDQQRMKRRRECILQYFLNKYDYKRADIEHFLNWATEMKAGEEHFINLCQGSQ